MMIEYSYMALGEPLSPIFSGLPKPNIYINNNATTQIKQINPLSLHISISLMLYSLGASRNNDINNENIKIILDDVISSDESLRHPIKKLSIDE